jgi:hypothetical protein
MAARLLPGGGWGFWLPLSVLPTKHPGWAKAGVRLKRRALDQAGKVAEKIWDASRARGLDRFGNPLAPIAEATRQARRRNINPVTGKPPYSPMGRAQPNAPPLTPVQGSSRTRSYLRWKVYPGRGVWFYWRYDFHTRHYWGAILARHAIGFTQRFGGRFRRVPARDVRGFSPAELAEIQNVMEQWGAQNIPQPEVPTHARVTHDILELITRPRLTPEDAAEVERQQRQLRQLATAVLGPGAGRESLESAIRQGTSTGFRQFSRRGGPTGLARLRGRR